MDLKDRYSKVDVSMFGDIDKPFPQSLPNILAAKDIKEVAAKIRECKEDGLKCILMMGAHPIKVGVSPFIIGIMKNGYFTHIAMNGACVVHDLEIAMEGKTSEDVEEALLNKNFGVTKDSIHFIESALLSMPKGFFWSFANCIDGNLEVPNNLKFKEKSIFCNKLDYQIMTVHTTLGTDIYHARLEYKALAALQTTNIIDYKNFLTTLDSIYLKGGVIINLGSAILFPEMFLKALSHFISGNQKLNKNITCINMDFQPSYRALNNIVNRPKLVGINTYNLIGCHEIMIPLLYNLVMEDNI